MAKMDEYLSDFELFLKSRCGGPSDDVYDILDEEAEVCRRLDAISDDAKLAVLHGLYSMSRVYALIEKETPDHDECVDCLQRGVSMLLSFVKNVVEYGPDQQ